MDRGNDRGKGRGNGIGKRVLSRNQRFRQASFVIDIDNLSFDSVASANNSGLIVSSPPQKKRHIADDDDDDDVQKWSELLPGYDIYYEDGPPEFPEIEKKIEAIEQFLVKTPFIGENLTGCIRSREGDLSEEQQQAYFSLIFEDVVTDERFCELWGDFGNDLVNHPEGTINLWSAVAHKLLYSIALAKVDGTTNSLQASEISRICIGFFKRDPVTSLTIIKADHIGKLLTIKGTVVGATNIQRYCKKLTFMCKLCDEQFTVRQPEGKFTSPCECKATLDCKNEFLFEPMENDSNTVILDCRRIKIQDELSCHIEKGTIPKTIDCILFGRDWAEMCNTGDVITLSGVLKFGVLEKSMHHTITPYNYIEVTAIQQQKDCERTMGGNSFSVTDKDYYAVRAIYDEPNLFRLLVASLCPAIYGHEFVKAGLLLSLLGGTKQNHGIISRRSDINMLMIGDPGIGKSQMLKAVSEIAPKAVYICGKGSTTAGLTVSLVKDGDDYSLEAGALVIADNGILCLDEFDKMDNHHALLEAMEQQTVSVAKCGVHRTLPARATVIAAANPIDGHYNTSKTIAENIKIHPAILSRFDLNFILMDKPNEEYDQRLVAHKRALRIGNECNEPKPSTSKVKEPSIDQTPRTDPTRFIEKIKVQMGDVFDPIPQAMYRKYIAYARQYVHPKLSPEAVEILKKYYMKLRVARRNLKSTPITTRQLESLVRLAEARAKAELRETVTAEDANEILELFEFSLSTTYENEVSAIGGQSASISLNHFGIETFKKVKSTQEQAKQLITVLRNYSTIQSKNLFSYDEINRMAEGLGYEDKTKALIAMLVNIGLLLMKTASTYQLKMEEF